MPTAQGLASALPNNFDDIEGSKGSGAVVKPQACYNGYLGERGMLSLQELGHDSAVKTTDELHTHHKFDLRQLHMDLANVLDTPRYASGPAVRGSE